MTSDVSAVPQGSWRLTDTTASIRRPSGTITKYRKERLGRSAIHWTISDKIKSKEKVGTMQDEKTAEAPEIEITPEMIDAGVNCLWRSPIDEPSEDDLRVTAIKVFTAMFAARRLPRRVI
jgi:hypothetical protein